MPGDISNFPGMGTEPCQGTSRSGRPCSSREIEGMDFCLHHVPDEALDEAEEITGVRRCRFGFGEPAACRFFAVKGTDPPRCKTHGAQVGSVQSKHASSNVVRMRVGERVQQVLAEHGEELLNAPPVENPLEYLQALAGEIWAWKEICRRVCARLETSNWRYEGARFGEQVRAELLMYGQAIDRAERILVNITKLNIEAVLARIDAARIEQMERALRLALEASGADLDGQDKARQVLLRELSA